MKLPRFRIKLSLSSLKKTILHKNSFLVFFVALITSGLLISFFVPMEKTQAINWGSKPTPTPTPKPPTPTPTPAPQGGSRNIIVSDDLPGLNIKQTGNLGIGLNIFDEHGVAINIEKGDIRMPNSAPLRMRDLSGNDQGVLMLAGDSLRINNGVNGGIIYMQRDAQAEGVPTGLYLFGGQSNQSEADFVLDSLQSSASNPKRNSPLDYKWARVWNNGENAIISSVNQVESSQDGPAGIREGILHQWFGEFDKEAAFIDFIMNGGPRYNIKVYQPLTLVPRTPPAIPEEGMMIYNQNTHKLNFWNGSAWEEVVSQ